MTSKVTYRQQFTRCGKQRCRKCKDEAGHGPYWYAYWSVNGRTVSKYIGKHLPENVETEINTRQSKPQIVSTLKTTLPSQHQVQEIRDVERPGTIKNSSIIMLDGSIDTQHSIRIYVLGQFRIELRHGKDWQIIASRLWQRRRARALLACLLSNTGRRLGREQAMEAIWPDLDIEKAANRLNGAVHEVRQILEPEIMKPALSQLLRLEQDVLQLADDHIWVDADAFEGLLNRANVTTDPLQAEQILEEAAQLYSGDYLLEELYSEWTATRRESLHRGWIGLLLKLAELRALRGALTSAIEPLDRLLSTDPTHETAVRRLMIVLTQLDRRGEALQLYQRLTYILKRDYASEPLPETYELYEALRQGYVYIPHSIPFQPVPDLETTPQIEVPFVPDTPSTTAINERIFQTFPRPILQFGRQNQSPLIGRDQELAILRQYLLTIANASSEETQNDKYDGKGQLIKLSSGDFPWKQKNCHLLLLMGESGIGKTRLAEELSLEANKRDWSVAWTHAYEQESTIPYRPWTDLLRTLLQSTPPKSLNSFLEVPFIPLTDDTTNSIHYNPDNPGSNFKLARLSALLPELTAYAQIWPL